MLIKIFAPTNVHLLEIAGVQDALFEANCKLSSGRQYRVQLVTEDGILAKSASGVSFLPDAGIGNSSEWSDTLIVAGPYGIPERPSKSVQHWLQEQAKHARRYGSTCTGAFVLADANLLSNRCVTTHWAYADRFATEFPDIQVQPDRIFVRDGPVFSSAGVTAAMDLTFSLIEEDHGRGLALWVARRLVVFLKRPGGQAQFSAALNAQTRVNSPFDKIQAHILENPHADLRLEALANIVGMSPRNLARLFQSRLAMSPAHYVEMTRIDIARGLLEEGQVSIKAIAHAAGFGSTATLRRAFLRRIGTTPAEYRSRFRTAG